MPPGVPIPGIEVEVGGSGSFPYPDEIHPAVMVKVGEVATHVVIAVREMFHFRCTRLVDMPQTEEVAELKLSRRPMRG